MASDRDTEIWHYPKPVKSEPTKAAPTPFSPPKREMTFTIPEQEAEQVVEWVMKHTCNVRNRYQGAIGGAITFSFTPTSIGEIVSVKCACGEEFHPEQLL